MSDYDVIVIGAGHNGLIAADYLAKAGMNVLVLEKYEKIGGGTMTAEVTAPGFKSDLASMAHQFIQSSPLIADDELGLTSKYGLEYLIYDGPQMAAVYDDGSSFIIYKDIDETCAQIEKFSPRDAVTYHQFYDAATKASQMLSFGMVSAPPKFGDFVAFLDDSPAGQDTLKGLFGRSTDVLNRMFESEQVKSFLARYTSEAMCAPFDYGTGGYLNSMIPGTHNVGMAVPKGGSQALPDALAAYLADAGGTIRTSAGVSRVIVQDGTATGVILESGETIKARRGVINACSVQQLFGTFISPDEPALPEDFSQKIADLQPSSVSAFVTHVALTEHAKFTAGVDNPDVDKCVTISHDPSWDTFQHRFLDHQLGNPSTDMFAFSDFSKVDTSRAPDGQAITELYHFAPPRLKGGIERYRDIGQQLSDQMMEYMETYTLNVNSDTIIAEFVTTPLDIQERDNAMRWGDIMHFGSADVMQFYGNRPLPGWSSYKTPIDHLYMVGASTYPGGGVTGGARAAVPLIMQYMGLDFDKVMA